MSSTALRALIIEAIELEGLAVKSVSAAELQRMLTRGGKLPNRDVADSEAPSALNAARMFWRMFCAVFGPRAELSPGATDFLTETMPNMQRAIELIKRTEML